MRFKIRFHLNYKHYKSFTTCRFVSTVKVRALNESESYSFFPGFYVTNGFCKPLMFIASVTGELFLFRPRFLSQLEGRCCEGKPRNHRSVQSESEATLERAQRVRSFVSFLVFFLSTKNTMLVFKPHHLFRTCTSSAG